jgi:hypothetical protein
MEIGHSIAKIVDQNVRFAVRFGEVTAKTTSPATISVKISGSSTAISNIRYLHSYAPQVGDIVVLIVNKGDIFALGDLA